MTLGEAEAAAILALRAAGIKAYRASLIHRDATTGEFDMPGDEHFIAVGALASDRPAKWAKRRPGETIIQITSFSRANSRRLTLLEDADAALPLPTWRVGPKRINGRLESGHLTGSMTVTVGT